MNKEKLKYIEDTGLLFERSGMTRMAGRIFGYLLICDEEAVSFSRIQKVLHASKGGISTNLKQLVQAELIEPVSLPGDRKTYYRPSHVEIGEILKGRASLIKKFADTFSRAGELKEKDDELSAWLLETSCFYIWIEEQMAGMIPRWENEKDKIINQIIEKK